MARELEQSTPVSEPPEESRSVPRSKRCDRYSDKDEDNSPKNVNNITNFLCTQVSGSKYCDASLTIQLNSHLFTHS